MPDVSLIFVITANYYSCAVQCIIEGGNENEDFIFLKFSQNKHHVRQIVFFPSPGVSSVCLLGKREKFREFTTTEIDPGQLSVRLQFHSCSQKHPSHNLFLVANLSSPLQ